MCSGFRAKNSRRCNVESGPASKTMERRKREKKWKTTIALEPATVGFLLNLWRTSTKPSQAEIHCLLWFFCCLYNWWPTKLRGSMSSAYIVLYSYTRYTLIDYTGWRNMRCTRAAGNGRNVNICENGLWTLQNVHVRALYANNVSASINKFCAKWVNREIQGDETLSDRDRNADVKFISKCVFSQLESIN